MQAQLLIDIIFLVSCFLPKHVNRENSWSHKFELLELIKSQS